MQIIAYVTLTGHGSFHGKMKRKIALIGPTRIWKRRNKINSRRSINFVFQPTMISSGKSQSQEFLRCL